MKFIDHVVRAIENRPDTFSCDKFHLQDNLTGCRYWVANGYWFYKLDGPSYRTFNLWEKWKFGRAFARWRDGYILSLVEH